MNPRPADYKSAALPTELHQRFSSLIRPSDLYIISHVFQPVNTFFDFYFIFSFRQFLPDIPPQHQFNLLFVTPDLSPFIARIARNALPLFPLRDHLETGRKHQPFTADKARSEQHTTAQPIRDHRNPNANRTQMEHHSQYVTACEPQEHHRCD